MRVLSNNVSGSRSGTHLPLPASASASTKIYRFHRFRFQLPLPLPNPWLALRIQFFTLCCKRLATAATFLQKKLYCLNAMKRNGPANSFHTSANCSEYNERFGLIQYCAICKCTISYALELDHSNYFGALSNDYLGRRMRKTKLILTKTIYTNFHKF